MSDIVTDMREILRRHGVSDDVAALCEAELRAKHGGDEVYVSRKKKGRLVEALEREPQADLSDLARRLGVSERRLRQIRQLTGK